VSLLRRFKRKFGIAARRVAVHTRAPWYLRWGLILAGFTFTAAMGWLAFDAGRTLAGFQSGKAAAEQTRLIEEIAHVQDENAELRSQLAALERQTQIDQATHGNLANQIKALTDENALLKEDVAFFQTLMTSGGESGGGGISINRFRVRQDALPGEYRYQLLIVQSRTRSREFQGKLQLVVNLEREGQQQVLVLPQGEEKGGPYNLSFKFYQRVDGVFRVPPDAMVRRVQVRVMENGSDTPKSSQTVNLS